MPQQQWGGLADRIRPRSCSWRACYVVDAREMFVEGNVSEVVSFGDAFVKWEKKASLKWKTINQSPQ